MDDEFGPVASPPGEPGRPARRRPWGKPPGVRARSRCAPGPMTPSDPAVGTGDGPAVDAPAASGPTPGDCSSGIGSAPRGRGDHGNAVVNPSPGVEERRAQVGRVSPAHLV